MELALCCSYEDLSNESAALHPDTAVANVLVTRLHFAPLLCPIN